MTTEIAMRREGNRLAPVDQIAADELGHIQIGKDVLVTVRVPRNIRQHRLAWAMAQKVAEACDWLHDREDAMDWLKIKARHVKIVHNPMTNHTLIVPKSIAFASLDQAAFSRLLNRMIFVICSEIVPGLDETALRAEIMAMVNGDEPEAKPAPHRRAPARELEPA
jgi:phosphoenolpyruvate carboxylase